MKSIAVFCSSNKGSNNNYAKTAEDLGRYLAKNKLRLVYGGANVGLMKCCAESAIKNNGEVIGIITHFLAQKHLTQTNVSKMITVNTMQERKAKLAEYSDGFIILPGGCGTMEEFFEVFTAAQLGFHQKPIVILNIDGYYDNLKAMFNQMVSEKMMLQPHVEMVMFAKSIELAFMLMKNYKAPVLGKWINDIIANEE